MKAERGGTVLLDSVCNEEAIPYGVEGEREKQNAEKEGRGEAAISTDQLFCSWHLGARPSRQSDL